MINVLRKNELHNVTAVVTRYFGGIKLGAGGLVRAYSKSVMEAAGKKVGLIKIRSFRPFPSQEIAEALKNVKAFAAMDKDDSFNAHCGPIFAETCAALYANGVTAPKGDDGTVGALLRGLNIE